VVDWNYGNECQGTAGKRRSVAVPQLLAHLALFTYASASGRQAHAGGPTVIRPAIAACRWRDYRHPPAGGALRRRQLHGSRLRRLLLRTTCSWSGGRFRRSRSPRTHRAAQYRGAQYLATIAIRWPPPPSAAGTSFGESPDRSVDDHARERVTSPRTSLQNSTCKPLVSAGDYGAIKEVASPRTFDFIRYGETPARSRPRQVGLRSTRTAPACSPFSIAAPTSRALPAAECRLPMEFRPGSSLFVVWTQQRRDRAPFGEFDLAPNLARLHRAGRRCPAGEVSTVGRRADRLPPADRLQRPRLG